MTYAPHIQYGFDEAWERARRCSARLTEPQARRLYDLAASAPRLVVEVGSYTGGSAVVLAAASQRVLCIDPFLYVDRSGPEIFATYLRNIFACPWGNRVSVATRPDFEVFPSLEDGIVTLLFIDHDHSERGTWRSIQGWLSKLDPLAQIAFHDYGHPRYPGVKTAVDQSGLEIIENVEGLVVCAQRRGPFGHGLVTPVDECSYRSDVRRENGTECATCRFVQEIIGVSNIEYCRVGRDACTACCREPKPTRTHWNPVVASHVFNVAQRIVAEGGADGCTVEQAAAAQEVAQQLVSLSQPGADRPPSAPRTSDACYYLGAEVGTRRLVTAEGGHRVAEFECGHPDHAQTTAETCRRCRDWAIVPRQLRGQSEPSSARVRPGSTKVSASRGGVRTWAVGVTTAPRRESTLEMCLDSLCRAGWEDVDLFVDTPITLAAHYQHLPVTLHEERIGAWPNYFLALWQLYAQSPGADAILLVQDDSIFYDRENLRQYLEETLWLTDPPGVVSLFCSAADTRDEPGWYVHQGAWTRGAQAFVFPKERVLQFLTDNVVVMHRRKGDAGLVGIDLVIGEWADRVGVPTIFPSPSLVQHIGDTSTLWNHARAVGARRAIDGRLASLTDLNGVLPQAEFNIRKR